MEEDSPEMGSGGYIGSERSWGGRAHGPALTCRGTGDWCGRCRARRDCRCSPRRAPGGEEPEPERQRGREQEQEPAQEQEQGGIFASRGWLPQRGGGARRHGAAGGTAGRTRRTVGKMRRVVSLSSENISLSLRLE